MAPLPLQDYSDSFRFMLFDKDYIENSKFFIVGYYLLVKGRVQKRKYKEDEIEFKIKTINLLSSVKDELIKSVTIKIDPVNIDNELINDLKELIQNIKAKQNLNSCFSILMIKFLSLCFPEHTG